MSLYIARQQTKLSSFHLIASIMCFEEYKFSSYNFLVGRQ